MTCLNHPSPCYEVWILLYRLLLLEAEYVEAFHVSPHRRFPYISRIQTEILLNAFIFSRKIHSFVQKFI
jgi:hypothetical protein